MKEKPILFSAPMIRVILSGNKTQTRRVIRPQPPKKFVNALCDCDGLCSWGETWDESDEWWPEGDTLKCPYGGRGTRLWVRESFCLSITDGKYDYDKKGNPVVLYRATENRDIVKDDGDGGTEFRKDGQQASPWVPSIHMNREYSRITLEITEVRVQRVSEISYEDAMAEGCSCKPTYPKEGGVKDIGAVDVFRELWESINGPRGFGWKTDPWCWCISFRRIKP